MRKLREIIVHCSATPEGREVSVATIRKWHKARGWSDIGYHFVIGLDGKIHSGRPLSKVGAHVAGRNTGTIGICYVGGVARGGRTPKDTRTPAQKRALESLILKLKTQYPTIVEVSGHNQYAAKACPSFDASKVYDHLVGRKTPTAKKPAQANERYRYLQKLLAGTGRSFGQIDGIEGKKTIAAIKDYQEFMGLSISGKFDAATVGALRAVEQDNIPVGFMGVVDDVAAEGRFSKEKMASGLGGTTATLYAINEFTGALGDTTANIKEQLPDWALPVLALAVAALFGFLWYRRNSKQKRALEAKESF